MPLSPDQRRALHQEMEAMTESLIAEYSGRHPAGAVIRCVARCREQLLRGGVQRSLVPDTEAAARKVLQRTAPVRVTA